MRYLLDTDILVYVLNARPKHQAVIERFRRENSRDLAVSSITLAELRFGIEKSQRREPSRRVLGHMLEALNVIPFGAEAAERYGVIRARLEEDGTPIGPLDTLIAAHALCLNLTLVTHNTREFSRVHGLRVETWIPT